MGVIGPESSRQLKLFARFAAAGFELAACIVVGYFGGGALDGWLKTAPYLAYTGLVLGIVAGFYNLFKLASTARTSADENPDSSPTKNDPDSPNSP